MSNGRNIFVVKRAWFEDTSPGHDKFYQPFLIQERDSTAGKIVRQLTLAHYGGRKAAREGMYSRPVVGGMIKLYGSIGAKFHDLQVEKRKKGYIEKDARMDEIGPTEDFVTWVREEFGATHGHDLLQHFDLTLDGEEIDLAALVPPNDASDTDDSEDERPEAWGSW